MYSSAYGTVHYKELLWSFEIRVGPIFVVRCYIKVMFLLFNEFALYKITKLMVLLELLKVNKKRRYHSLLSRNIIRMSEIFQTCQWADIKPP